MGDRPQGKAQHPQLQPRAGVLLCAGREARSRPQRQALGAIKAASPPPCLSFMCCISYNPIYSLHQAQVSRSRASRCGLRAAVETPWCGKVPEGGWEEKGPSGARLAGDGEGAGSCRACAALGSISSDLPGADGDSATGNSFARTAWRSKESAGILL